MSRQKISNLFPAAVMVVCLVAAIVAGSAGTSLADFVYLNSDNGYNESWLTASDWSNGAAPSSGNDYHVGWDDTNYANRLLRSPPDVSATFGGGSLTLHAGAGSTGIFALKGKHSNIITINDLRLNGGMVVVSYTAGTNWLAGNITVNSDSKIDLVADDGRYLTISALLTGSGGLEVFQEAGNSSTLRLTHLSNTYTGDWTITAGKLWANASDSLGSGDITVGTNGKIDVDYDHYNADAAFTLYGLMTLDADEDHTFGAITIDGTSLSPGTYDFDYLNTNFDANFVNGGGGTLTVIPEPSTLALLATGLIGLLCYAWRKRK